MKTKFERTNLGLMKNFLGIKINQSKNCIYIFQSNYAKDIFRRFRMVNCEPTVIPIATGTKLSNKDHGSSVDTTLYKKTGW